MFLVGFQVKTVFELNDPTTKNQAWKSYLKIFKKKIEPFIFVGNFKWSGETYVSY